MSFSNKTKNGLNFAPAYQITGFPYVTSSAGAEVKGPAGGNHPIIVEFPNVTNNFKIRNTGPEELRVAFSFSGSYAPGESVAGGGTKSSAQGRNFLDTYRIRWSR
jgi:hypothetical protein